MIKTDNNKNHQEIKLYGYILARDVFVNQNV